MNVVLDNERLVFVDQLRGMAIFWGIMVYVCNFFVTSFCFVCGYICRNDSYACFAPFFL